ncbi:MAG: DUF2442 domain-containing protein [Sulfobacillus sp.]
MRVTPLLVSAEVIEGHRVRIAFDDGTVADVDLGWLVGSGPVFEPHREYDYFCRLCVDEEANTIVWPNDTDIAPETLYELARHEQDRLHRTSA